MPEAATAQDRPTHAMAAPAAPPIMPSTIRTAPTPIVQDMTFFPGRMTRTVLGRVLLSQLNESLARADKARSRQSCTLLAEIWDDLDAATRQALYGLVRTHTQDLSAFVEARMSAGDDYLASLRQPTAAAETTVAGPLPRATTFEPAQPDLPTNLQVDGTPEPIRPVEPPAQPVAGLSSDRAESVVPATPAPVGAAAEQPAPDMTPAETPTKTARETVATAPAPSTRAAAGTPTRRRPLEPLDDDLRTLSPSDRRRALGRASIGRGKEETPASPLLARIEARITADLERGRDDAVVSILAKLSRLPAPTIHHLHANADPMLLAALMRGLSLDANCLGAWNGWADHPARDRLAGAGGVALGRRFVAALRADAETVPR